MERGLDTGREDYGGEKVKAENFRCKVCKRAPELVVTHTNEEKDGRDGEEGRRRKKKERKKKEGGNKLV